MNSPVDNTIKHSGSCLCGSVRFAVSAEFDATDACHCKQCRQWTGHYLVSADVPRTALNIESTESLVWYQSSQKVRRGFCGECGSSLFFDPLDTQKHNWIAIAMGTFDTPTGSTIHKHIFTEEQGDYYDTLASDG